MNAECNMYQRRGLTKHWLKKCFGFYWRQTIFRPIVILEVKYIKYRFQAIYKAYLKYIMDQNAIFFVVSNFRKMFSAGHRECLLHKIFAPSKKSTHCSEIESMLA